MSEELKPCPFCGGEDIYLKEVDLDFAFSTYYHVRCLTCNCNLDSIQNTSKSKAIEAWNRRV